MAGGCWWKGGLVKSENEKLGRGQSCKPYRPCQLFLSLYQDLVTNANSHSNILALYFLVLEIDKNEFFESCPKWLLSPNGWSAAQPFHFELCSLDVLHRCPCVWLEYVWLKGGQSHHTDLWFQSFFLCHLVPSPFFSMLGTEFLWVPKRWFTQKGWKNKESFKGIKRKEYKLKGGHQNNCSSKALTYS